VANFPGLINDPNDTGAAAPEVSAPAPLVPLTQAQPGPWGQFGNALQQVGLAAQEFAGPYTSPGIRDAVMNHVAREKERQRKQRASDQAGAITSMVSSALTSGNQEAINSTLQQLGKLKGLEPEAVEKLGKMQMDLGVKIKEDMEQQKLAELVSDPNNPQGQMLRQALQAAPGQKMADLINFAKIAASETAAHTEFKSLPEKLKTAVFAEAVKRRVTPDEFLKLAQRGEKEAVAGLQTAVEAVSGASMDNNMYDRLAVMHFGARGATSPLGVTSFGQLATNHPEYARQIVTQAQKMEAEQAALQKGIIVEAQLATQLRMENAQPPKINQFWVDKDKLVKDPGMPLNAARELNKPLGEIRSNPRRFAELDEVQRRQIESFTGVEAVLNEIEAVIPGLPKKGGLATLMNRAKNPVQRYLGTSGIANEVGTLQLGSLFLGRTFQGAASQLSDRDVAMASYANITDGDSQESIKQKVAISRRLSQRFKLAMAGVDIRELPSIFSKDEYEKAVTTFGAPATPVPGTRLFSR
jgi:hypothetical protein